MVADAESKLVGNLVLLQAVWTAEVLAASMDMKSVIYSAEL